MTETPTRQPAAASPATSGSRGNGAQAQPDPALHTTPAAQPEPTTTPGPTHQLRIPLLGLLLAVELVLLAAILVPLIGHGDSRPDSSQAVDVLWWTVTVNQASLFVLVTLAAGALGGTLHGVASLTTHVAAGDFDSRWTMWYLLNPLVAAALAAVFLFVLQAGLGGTGAPATPNGLFGIAAFAALSGLFSRHALDKLRDIFDVAFAARNPSGKAPADD